MLAPLKKKQATIIRAGLPFGTGGGHKRNYRIIDFRRDKDGIPATVAAIEYDLTTLQISPCFMQTAETLYRPPWLQAGQ